MAQLRPRRRTAGFCSGALTRIEFSAAFYSSGRATTTSDNAAADALVRNGGLGTTSSRRPADSKRLPLQVRAGFEDIGHYENGRGVRILLRENAGNPAGP